LHDLWKPLSKEHRRFVASAVFARPTDKNAHTRHYNESALIFQRIFRDIMFLQDGLISRQDGAGGVFKAMEVKWCCGRFLYEFAEIAAFDVRE
jgi:hypothetical protein